MQVGQGRIQKKFGPELGFRGIATLSLKLLDFRSNAAGNTGGDVLGELKGTAFRNNPKRLAGGIVDSLTRPAMHHVGLDLLSKRIADRVVQVVGQFG